MILKGDIMNKKLLKGLLCILGLGLLIGAGAVVYLQGHAIYGVLGNGLSSEFILGYVDFEYVVALAIGGIICLIISICIKSNKE